MSEVDDCLLLFVQGAAAMAVKPAWEWLTGFTALSAGFDGLVQRDALSPSRADLSETNSLV